MSKKPDSIVKLVATKDDYKKIATYVCPKYHEGRLSFEVNGKEYVGAHKQMGDKMQVVCDDTPLLLTPDVSLPIQDGMTFDLDNPKQEFLYQLALGSGYVTPPGERVNIAYHRFKIEDKEQAAVEKSSRFDMVVRAANMLRDLSTEQMRDLAVILSVNKRKYNIDVRGMSVNQIEAFLKSLCEKDPKAIISSLDDQEYKYKVFLQKLVLNGIVSRDGAAYRNGDTLVGADENYAILFLKERENEKLVTQWGEILKSRETPIKAPAKEKPAIDKVIQETVPEIVSEEMSEEAKAAVDAISKKTKGRKTRGNQNPE